MKIKLAVIGGVLLLTAGAVLLVSIMRSHAANIVSSPAVHGSPVLHTQAGTVQGDPVKVDIPSLGLSLPVVRGYYDSKTKAWTLTKDKVQYATLTPPPSNQDGNTLLYGHYRKGVFATLHTIKPGAPAVVTASNGHKFYYRFASSKVTNPNDNSVFKKPDHPILTVQTCTGIFFQNRQLFTFDLVRTV
jgi:LPXTG-site transpeptidase (sortase) family protein